MSTKKEHKGNTVKMEEETVEQEIILTDSEKELMRKIREFEKYAVMKDEIKDIWVRQDEAQFQFDHMEWNARLRLHKIRELMSHIKQNNLQIKSGEIKRFTDDSKTMLMTVEELALENEMFMLQVEKEISGIRANLANMIKFVGIYRMDKKLIITEGKMTSYIKDIQTKVKNLTGMELI